MTNTLSGYRKLNNFAVAAQSLLIDFIDYFTGSSMVHFENITTVRVEYSDEIFEKGVNWVGTFVLVADESIRYDFEITYKNGAAGLVF